MASLYVCTAHQLLGLVHALMTLDGVNFCKSSQINGQCLSHTMKSLQRILMMVPFS